MSGDAPTDLFAVTENNKSIYRTTVALFKETTERCNRLLADSESFLAYTLKNGTTLRFVSRPGNVKGSLKHTGAVHNVKFVNYRSNVGASASANEFLVWVVTNDSAEGEEAAANADDQNLL
ncbi:hypothetical protein ADEAN_000683300 [Angomonas deanei]|uniref:Uncharacterized protein n=1 Tax=Angomonas deanei TaxID=59799 RepID=A0A7G2CHJ3_9TRYP|nr:hypothetical protein ADEAN_000683300 [Angomonas deanei]